MLSTKLRNFHFSLPLFFSREKLTYLKRADILNINELLTLLQSTTSQSQTTEVNYLKLSGKVMCF
jgi:hypothetical protein